MTSAFGVLHKADPPSSFYRHGPYRHMVMQHTVHAGGRTMTGVHVRTWHIEHDWTAPHIGDLTVGQELNARGVGSPEILHATGPAKVQQAARQVAAHHLGVRL